MMPPELALRSATVAILLLTAIVNLRDRRHRDTGSYGRLLALSVAADSVVTIASIDAVHANAVSDGNSVHLPRIRAILDAAPRRSRNGRAQTIAKARAEHEPDILSPRRSHRNKPIFHKARHPVTTAPLALMEYGILQNEFWPFATVRLSRRELGG
jgi:hypothetical protein